MPTGLIGQNAGPRLNVPMMMKSPTFIPRRTLSMLDQAFITDAVLRSGDDIPSGIALYFETTPLFTDADPAILDEFGRIPVTSGSTGTPRVVRSVRRALGLRISKQMVDRNQVTVVNDQMTQLRNTMVRAWEDAFWSAIIANANVQTLTTDQPWGGASTVTHIRKDINAARYVAKNAASDAAGKQKLGYSLDTMIVSWETEFDFLDSDEVAKPYIGGNIADENLEYTGKLPNKFLQLDVLSSWRLHVYAPNSVFLCQRNVFGFISDERRLEATPMYGEGGGPNGGPTESWRSDFTRASAIGIDQPKAGVFISGVTASETFPAGTGDAT